MMTPSLSIIWSKIHL